MTADVASDVLAALETRGWTLAVAESLTGGAVCAELVGVPGASRVLLGGVVAYATAVKQTVLGVEPDLLAESGPVHPEVARQMAEGVRHAVAVEGRAADVGISTTGIAGPDSPDGQPVGTVHVGVALPFGSRTAAFHFGGDRSEIRSQAVRAVLGELHRVLKDAGE